MDLSERIRQLRLDNNLTAKEFGNIFEVSESTVSLYENNKRTPNKNLIIKISEYFDISTDYLLGKTNIPRYHYNFYYRQNSRLDVTKEVEKLLSQIDNNEYITFDGNIMNKQIKTLLKKSLNDIVETTRLLSNVIY